MAITIFHRVINNNKIRIINKETKPEHKAIQVKGDIKATRHTISEIKEHS